MSIIKINYYMLILLKKFIYQMLIYSKILLLIRELSEGDMKMNKQLLSGAFVALALLFLSGSLVQGAEAIGVAITSVNFAAPSPEKENLEGEWVEITNKDTAPQSLTGWTLEDEGNHTYTFPEFSLNAGASVKVHTGEGTDTSRDLYWNRSTSVWNNGGDVATLKDASGKLVSSYAGGAEEA